MEIHEFQAKALLRNKGVTVPPYEVVSSPSDLLAAMQSLGVNEAVVKVQVHAGGRGKAGGVKVGKSREEIQQHVEKLLGLRIVNNQTGPKGIVARSVLLSPLVDIAKEYYASVVIDRKCAQATLILSPEGGVDIEEVAVKHPEKILHVPIPANGKLKHFVFERIGTFMGWNREVTAQGKKIVQGMIDVFFAHDAVLVEINPLVLTSKDQLIALDAKVTIDDNALFRHPELAAFYDPSQITPAEASAREQNLSYIALDGHVGCMVNGAGLAMATMDIIHHYGGTPANFLDVGGSATQEKIAEGFKIILSDPQVKAILVNIFGGIMNCATLAAGIIAAANQQEIRVPLIVRMEGTNVEEGKRMLREAKLNIDIADGFEEAAKRAVSAVKQDGQK